MTSLTEYQRMEVNQNLKNKIFGSICSSSIVLCMFQTFYFMYPQSTQYITISDHEFDLEFKTNPR